MDIKAYIDSGILEAYALGFATEAEILDVEAKLQQYPQLHDELEEIQHALNSNAVSYAKIPPSETKEKIRNVLFSEKISQPALKKQSFPLTAIAAIIAVVAVAGNIWFYMQNQHLRNQVVRLESEKSTFVEANESLKVRYDAANSWLAFVSRPEIRKVEMKPVGDKVNSSAIVYWNQQDGQLLVNVKDLPQAPVGFQYQLWAIVDGKPVDLGLYDRTATFQEMKEVNQPQAFAVTLEKEGGSPVPTMEQMVVMGGV